MFQRGGQINDDSNNVYARTQSNFSMPGSSEISVCFWFQLYFEVSFWKVNFATQGKCHNSFIFQRVFSPLWSYCAQDSMSWHEDGVCYKMGKIASCTHFRTYSLIKKNWYICTFFVTLISKTYLCYLFHYSKFLDAGIQDVSTSISIVHDLIEISQDEDEDGDESDKHI